MLNIEIARCKLGGGSPCFVIAEAGVNHNGDLNLAKQLIDVAVDCGADAVKFQTFKADRQATIYAPKAQYQIDTTGDAESQFDMLRKLELSESYHRQLYEYCIENNILFLSSPFDEQSADLLENIGVAAFKIPSGEITNLSLLSHVAAKGKPLIVSTGMSNLSEVEIAVDTIISAGNDQIVLLQCVSNYPADPKDVNLRAMVTLQKAFGFPVGYSDHTLGIEVALGAVAMGACVVEKHFTLDSSLPGPDHRISLEPAMLQSMIKGIRIVESALGDGRKVATKSEEPISVVARKSLVAAYPLAKGTVLTRELITIKRPGTGLYPAMLDYILGRKLKASVPADSILTLDMFE